MELERTRLWTDRRDERGPFDVIGDVHGCGDELEALLAKLGYEVARQPGDDSRDRYEVRHPQGRKLVFLGDLVDRGPRIADVLALVMDAVESGAALCVPGNHETKLLRKLQGRDVKVGHGLAQTLEQLEAESEAFRARVARFIDGLVSHYELDGGQLVVAHAGLRESMHGRASGAVRAFALYGETTGETDEFGVPVRYDWASEYRGRAMVVYGHTPVPEIDWLNHTVCIDTGCVFGGQLSALRYPERGTAQHVEKFVRAYRRCQDAEELSREAHQRRHRFLGYRYGEDGSLVLRHSCRRRSGRSSSGPSRRPSRSCPPSRTFPPERPSLGRSCGYAARTRSA